MRNKHVLSGLISGESRVWMLFKAGFVPQVEGMKKAMTLRTQRQISTQLNKLTYKNSAIVVKRTNKDIRSETLFWKKCYRGSLYLSICITISDLIFLQADKGTARSTMLLHSNTHSSIHGKQKKKQLQRRSHITGGFSYASPCSLHILNLWRGRS